MSERDTVAVLFVLLLVAASLLYLDWRRQGEIDNLHERVDALDRRLRSGDAAPDAQSTVERVLRASDDRTLADIAREGA